MYNVFSKLLMLSLLLPLLVVFLPKDCGEKKRNTGGQTAETNTEMNELQTGLWGGDGIRLEVTAQGAQIEYACAHGSIKQKIVPDANGSFNVKGTHTRERGGPIRDDETANNRPAQFSGQIKDKTMSLTVTETETEELIGTFTLVFGQRTRLVKCR